MDFSEPSGFMAGDLDCSGYFFAIPAFQQIFIGDGRPYNTDITLSGYHRIDMVNTSLVGEADGFFEIGEVITQDETGAKGIFIETIDVGDIINLIYRTTTKQFDTTEVIGANSGATLIPLLVVNPPHWLNWTPKLFISGTITGEFSVGEYVEQAESGAVGQVYEMPSSLRLVVFQASDIKFDAINLITGDTSGATIAPTGVSGYFPDGGSNSGRLFDGRIWLNSVWESNQYLVSRQNDPFDFNVSEDIEDVQAAFSSQTSLAGQVSEPLIDFIPYKNAYVIFALCDSMWILHGGSTGGGQFANLTTETGLFSPNSWCFDENGNLYIIGINGFYKISIDNQQIDNISNRLTPKLFKTLALSRITDRVAMGFDRDRGLVNITISLMDGNWSASFCYDPIDDSIFPDSHTERQIPSCYAYITDPQSNQTGLWVGSYDGYIRKWDENKLTDDGEIIPSQILFGPIQISALLRPNIKIKKIEVILSEDTTGITWKLFTAESAEKLKQNIENGKLPLFSGTLTTGGRQPLIDEKISGEFLGIVFSNNISGTSWGVEKLVISFIIAGKDKG